MLLRNVCGVIYDIAAALMPCPVEFTPEERERFKTDPEFYRNFRTTLEREINVRAIVLRRRIRNHSHAP